MNNKLFRKSVTDRMNSPEQMNEYIRVVEPSLYLVSAALILLILGVAVWGIQGRIETSANAAVSANSGEIICYINTDENIKSGMTVKVNGYIGKITEVSSFPVRLNPENDDYLLYILNSENTAFFNKAKIDIDELNDGIYPAQVITSSVPPISFIFN